MIPVTGFALDRVTDLSKLPVTKYDALDSVTLEVPILKLKLPIVGVPLKKLGCQLVVESSRLVGRQRFLRIFWQQCFDRSSRIAVWTDRSVCEAEQAKGWCQDFCARLRRTVIFMSSNRARN